MKNLLFVSLVILAQACGGPSGSSSLPDSQGLGETNNKIESSSEPSKIEIESKTETTSKIDEESKPDIGGISDNSNKEEIAKEIISSIPINMDQEETLSDATKEAIDSAVSEALEKRDQEDSEQIYISVQYVKAYNSTPALWVMSEIVTNKYSRTYWRYIGDSDWHKVYELTYYMIQFEGRDVHCNSQENWAYDESIQFSNIVDPETCIPL